jgi:hypothetical protein
MPLRDRCAFRRRATLAEMEMVTAWIKANIATRDEVRNLADALDVRVLNATIDAAIAEHDARRPRA